MEKIGQWAFIIGTGLAIIAGLVTATSLKTQQIIAVILVLTGIVVGFMNITEKETEAFLIAAIALVVAGSAGADLSRIITVANLGTYIQAVLSNIKIFVAPAAIVVALKALYEKAQD